jgi:serine/threonine protein kinase
VLHVRKKGEKKDFALKKMMKAFLVQHDILKHIINEVKIMYQFSNCPNIVKISDHFEDDDYIYL